MDCKSSISTCASVALLILSLGFPASAQDSPATNPPNQDLLPNLYVYNIIVRGNVKTEEYVIMREMKLQPGDLIVPEDLEYDVNRIYNLGIFSRVEVSIEHIEDSLATIYLDVDESLSIIPFPIIGIKDRDWDKLYVGAGILHNNFRGRNEKIVAAVALGYDPWLTVRYRNPLFDEINNLFFTAEMSFSRIRNKSLYIGISEQNFDERHLSTNVTIGKRIGHHAYPSVMFSYRYVRVAEQGVGRTLSPRGRDEFLSVGAGFTYDSRDLQEYATRGTYAALSITRYGLGESVVDYHRLRWDLRKFVPIPRFLDLTLAARSFGTLSGDGLVPPYAHVYFGYTERIRGHFSKIYEGENILGLSAEVRIPLLKPEYFTVDFIPLPALRIWRFGMNLAVFTDAGKVWFRPQDLNLTNLIKGYGMGLHFSLPYGIIVRSEYAWNEQQEGEFIVDLKAAF
ncbi:MAG: BamA/TamA family outer membrane protein [Bacteroidota bacterium]